MSWKGILRRGGVNLVGPDGSNDWNFEGIVNARNIVSRFAGSHFHVDSNHTNASDGSGYGKRKDKPFAKIDYAVGQCVANNADVIWVHAGHTEAVILADGLALDVEGITIVFLGNGDDQAKITFGGVVGADMNVDADNITLINPRFEAALDALTGPIDINKANFTIINGEYYDAANKATTDCVIALAAAKGLTIDGWKYFESTTGTQKQSNLQLSGVDDLTLKNIDIRGNFAVSNLEGGDELLNLRFEDIYMDNLATTTPCMTLNSNCDGFAKNVSLRVTSGTTYVSDVSDINWGHNCLGFSADGGAGDPIGTAPSGGIEGKIDVIDEYHDVPAKDNVLNAQINEVLGNKEDTTAADAVTETDTIVGYIKQLVAGGIARDAVLGALNTAAATGAVTNADLIMGYVKQLVTEGIARDGVIGALDTAEAAGAVTDADLIMAYVKQLVTLAIARDTAIGVIDDLHDVPIADAATNLYARDVVGIKTDAAINAVTTTKTLMAYLKGVLNEITVPAQNNTDNTFINDVIGQKTDAAAADAVTVTDTLVGYIKQLVTAAIADAAQTLKLDGVTIATAPVAASLASFVASGGTSLGKQLPVSTSLVDLLGDFTGPHDGSAVDDNVKAALDIMIARQDRNVSTTAAFMSTGLTAFNIAGGPIEILAIIAECISLNDNTASTLIFTADPTNGAATNLCAASATLADAVAGTIVNITGTLVDAAVISVNGTAIVQAGGLVAAAGIIALTVGVGTTTGTWKIHMRYRPLASNAVVTAAY